LRTADVIGRYAASRTEIIYALYISNS